MKRVVVSPVIRNEKDELYTLQTVFRFLSNGAEVWMDKKHSDHAYSSGAMREKPTFRHLQQVQASPHRQLFFTFPKTRELFCY